MKYKIYLLCFVLVATTFLGVGQLFAKENLNTIPIKVSVHRMEPDSRGTDITNIYTVTVDFRNDTQRTNALFTVIVFENDREVKGYNNVTLPFSYKRNYRGLGDGEHNIKIDLENNETYDVVGSEEVLISVTTEKYHYQKNLDVPEELKKFIENEKIENLINQSNLQDASNNIELGLEEEVNEK